MRIAADIIWDYGDCEDIILPSELEIPEEIRDEDIGEYISEVTGFCHKGYTLEDV